MKGKEIRKLRESLHLNQTEFGKKVGVSKNTVSNWENNLTEIPKTVLHLLKDLEEKTIDINQSIVGNNNSLVGGNSNTFPYNDNDTTIEELKRIIQYLKEENNKKEKRISKLLTEQEELHKQISKLIDKIK
ncbi:MAG: helix-turn-helix domain-containing protein [Bacteroidales bacterium]|nr:helix-turn-helix domain-containing protein [Bacteroidales bacterium]MDY6424261.1 helix-turn-helix domain-containing protein [Bacteroidales bacterium]